MPEIVLPPAPPVSPNVLVGGDTTFEPDLDILFTNTNCVFGRAPAKGGNRGAITHFDTSGIPLGDVNITRCKFEVMPSATDTLPFTVDIDVLELNTRLDAVDIVDHDAQFILRPAQTIFGPWLWADARSSGEDITLFKKGNTGIGNVTQAWTASASAPLRWHIWYLERSATLSGMSIGCNLWSTTGPAGARRKNTLLDTGTLHTSPDAIVNLGSPAATYLQTSSSSGHNVTSGVTYISELVTTGGVSGRLGINLLSTAPNGGTDNLSILAYAEGGSRKISGFQERGQWLTGARIGAAATRGTTDSITAPGFTNNSLHSFGNSGSPPAGYSPSTSLTNFKSNLQSALRARTSLDQWIGIRLQDFSGTVNDRERFFKSVRHADTSVPPHRGMVLTIDYEPILSPGQFLKPWEGSFRPNPLLRQ